jgi:hypothetical protein
LRGKSAAAATLSTINNPTVLKTAMNPAVLSTAKNPVVTSDIILITLIPCLSKPSDEQPRERPYLPPAAERFPPLYILILCRARLRAPQNS